MEATSHRAAGGTAKAARVVALALKSLLAGSQ
jgi:hypothetical protein